ncbi:MAG: hypothetical protein ACKVJX_13575 [Verrucomicrobiia bacterium]
MYPSLFLAAAATILSGAVGVDGATIVVRPFLLSRERLAGYVPANAE